MALPQVRGASVHWYGKADVALQRKIGHITITAPDRGTTLERLAAVDSEAAAALSTSASKPQTPPCKPSQAPSMLIPHIVVSLQSRCCCF